MGRTPGEGRRRKPDRIERDIEVKTQRRHRPPPRGALELEGPSGCSELEFRPLNPLLTSHSMWAAPERSCDLGRDNFLSQGNPHRGLTAEGHLLVTLLAPIKGNLGKGRARALHILPIPHILIPALQITIEAQRS